MNQRSSSNCFKLHSSAILARWLTALLLIGLSIAAIRVAKKHLFDDNFGCVEEAKIYRSGQIRTARLEHLIRKYGLRTILHANELESSSDDAPRFRAICSEKGVTLIPVIMSGDGRGEFAQYDAAVQILLDESNLPALVCCARGTHRTGAIIASYRVLAQGRSVTDALKEMERYRFRPYPHRYKGKEHPLLPHLREYFASRSFPEDEGAALVESE